MIDFAINKLYITYMWTPVDILYLCFFLNLAPDTNARLNVREAIENKENKVIAETISLRVPQY